jgi:hypothetical protein
VQFIGGALVLLGLGASALSEAERTMRHRRSTAEAT